MKMKLILLFLVLFSGMSSIAQQPKKQLRRHKHKKHIMKHHVQRKRTDTVKMKKHHKKEK